MKQINSIKTEEEFIQEVSKNKNVIRAIKLYCYSCSSYQLSEVKNCTVTNCPLFPFRNGTNPFRKREVTDEERQRMRERLKQNKPKHYYERDC